MVDHRAYGEDADILEKGAVYFVYRTASPRRAVRSAGDVERVHMVLRPDGHGHCRVALIGRKRLPDRRDNQRTWGFVQAVAGTTEEVAGLLGHDVRPAGRGAYAVLQRDRAMHLLYALDPADRPGPAHKALNVQAESSVLVAVQAPGAATAADPGDDVAERRVRPAGPGMLDFVGAEFVLLGAEERLVPPSHAGDLEALTRPEDASDDTVARVLRQLRFALARRPVPPLF
jgi:hypothetical protein